MLSFEREFSYSVKEAAVQKKRTRIYREVYKFDYRVWWTGDGGGGEVW